MTNPSEQVRDRIRNSVNLYLESRSSEEIEEWVARVKSGVDKITPEQRMAMTASRLETLANRPLGDQIMSRLKTSESLKSTLRGMSSKKKAKRKTNQSAGVQRRYDSMSAAERKEHARPAQEAAVLARGARTEEDQLRINKRIGDSVKKARAEWSVDDREAFREKCRKAQSAISQETIDKRRITKLNRPAVECPHCGRVGRSPGHMSRHHFDNCRVILR